MKPILFALLTLMSLSAHAAKAAFHGFLLFGDKVTYASHLPMYHSPHNYQILLQVHFVGASETLAAYQQARNAGQLEFTLAPQPFDLTQVADGSLKELANVELYSGHFEKGGKLLGHIDLIIDKVLYGQILDVSEPEQSNYLVFGQNPEYFAAHLINGAPSFDTIMQVGQPYDLHLNACRGECPPIKMPVGDGKLPKKLKYAPLDGHDVKPVANDQIGEVGGTITEVKKIIYSESDDLK